MSAHYVAKWSGMVWSTLGSGMAGDDSPTVFALAVDDTGPTVYAGGRFATAGGVSSNSIAKWDGSAWAPLGSGMEYGPVDSLVVDDAGNVYAGGRFVAAGGASAHHIAKWDGSVWSPLGTGLDDDVSVLTLDSAGAAIYAGGYFTTWPAGSAPPTSPNGMARPGRPWAAVWEGRHTPRSSPCW